MTNSKFQIPKYKLQIPYDYELRCDRVFGICDLLFEISKGYSIKDIVQSRIQWYLPQSRGFNQSENNIHILYRLSGCPFHQVVDG